MNGETQSDKPEPSDPSSPVQPSPAQSSLVQPPPPSATVPKRPCAWQPLTPKGIATFAGATFGRVVTVQFVFALLAAAAVVWFLSRDWVPVISRAIRQMPTEGKIQSGRLSWAGESPISLAENRFLALAVDLKHGGEVRSPAHVAVEFGERTIKIYSLLGYIEGQYPRGWWIGFNRTDATPWWGAWAPPILGIVAILVIMTLLPSWATLATVYAGPAWIAGFLADRKLSFGESWRISGAALMPGCVFLIGAIFIYGLGLLDLVRLGVGFAAHLVIGWVYIVLTIRNLPLHPDVAAMKSNPFGTSAVARKLLK